VSYGYFDNHFVRLAIVGIGDLHECLFEQDVMTYDHFSLLVIYSIPPVI
jgi:hypothetical protein